MPNPNILNEINSSTTAIDTLTHSPFEQPALWLELIAIALMIAASFYFIFQIKQKLNQKNLKNIPIYDRLCMLIKPFAGLLVFLTIDLIVFGAFTRLSDSGLGCPDWPGCYATSNPLFANSAITTEQSLNPAGPVTITKSWIEMIHRYLAASIGLLIIFLLYLSYRRYRCQPSFFAKKSLKRAMILLILVLLQGAFGAWTVTYKLQPIIVSMHLILALVLLGNIIWFYLNERQNLAFLDQPKRHQNFKALNFSDIVHQNHRHLLKAFKIFFIFLLLQIFLGAWVSTNHAVFGCTESLTCLSESIGHSAFSYANWGEAFTFWRTTDYQGLKALEMPVLTGIHLSHRIGAFLLLAAYMYLWLRARRLKSINLNAGMLDMLPPETQKYIWAIGLLLVAQIATGIANVVLNHPLLAALIHTFGATMLVVCAIFAYHPLHVLYHYHKNQ